ncbi:MAG: pyridoxal phosphate-dependent aminotransferase [Thermoproteota archaeon]|nr:MAG: pyridoxal phosphate-dependent aminotransferase [Candidatus Korarchaeota archaeon]RLG56215.1 MAG: pyridoxal phosphate-dependent aminotransferase [Candidatus Korarchaeota archaeon]
MWLDWRIAERMRGLGVESAFIVLGKAKELEAKGMKVYHFEIGEPDFDTPGHIKEAAYRALADGFTHYTPSNGIQELREAIAEYESQRKGVDIKPENVVVTVGAKLAIFAAMMATLNPGDEVIVPSPAYPAYAVSATFAGAKVVKVKLSEEKRFSFGAEDIQEKTGEKTKMVVINTPSNPTGLIMSEQDLRSLAEIAAERRLIVVSDEIYDRIVFDGKKASSILEHCDSLDNVIYVNGFSKTFAMTGWRLGYAITAREVAEHIMKIQLNTVSCPTSFVQRAAIEALKGPQEPVEQMVREYQRRRDLVVEVLNRTPGVRCLKPEGAFYAFPNITELGLSSDKVADELLQKKGVALLPGTAFGEEGEGYLRISFATSIEDLREGLEKFREYAEEKLS